jgi:hypothetical protein
MKNIIFETKEQYLNAIQSWKDSCKDKDIQFTAEHFALYAIIRGKDPKKCFATPEQQSKRKLTCQGKTGNETYDLAMHRIKEGYTDTQILEPFQGNLTLIDLMKMRGEWDEDTLNDMKLQRMGAM